MWCAYIAEAHHVVSVEKGGDGWEDNLLFLCPNCHAIVEKMKTSAIEDPRFHDWIRATWGEDFYLAAGAAAGYMVLGE